MPFITEELWQNIYDRKDGESIMMVRQPAVALYDEAILERFDATKAIISAIRSIRLEKNLPNKEVLQLQVLGAHDETNDSVLLKLGNLSAIDLSAEKASGAVSFMVGTSEYAVPLSSLVDAETEIAKIEAEISYLEGFLQSVMKKLNNVKFVANANPQVVEAERKKKSDAETKITYLRESLAAFRK